MKKSLLFLFAFALLSVQLFSQKYTYTDNWDQSGFNLKSQSSNSVTLNYSVTEFSLDDITIRGEAMKEISLSGHFLPNDEGAPDLPGNGRFIAIPEGAVPVLKIIEQRTEVYKNVNIAPAPRIPKVTDKGPLVYNKNEKIYSNNSFYPAQPVKLSDVKEIRGVDAVILGITPFQYNPITKELIVYRDLKIEIEFEGGTGQFGEDRLRSRWFDPILRDAVLNDASIPEIDYAQRLNGTRTTGCEYLLIVPNNPVFMPWADSLKKFRNMQGILTEIVTIAEIGGNNAGFIESYINNAYDTWDIPPVAVLLMADFGSDDNGIMSPIWDDYCASDHTYADVTGDDIEEIILARMTAQNESQLENMVRKAIDYEADPPTNPDFYDHPITALGFQLSRWFQICSESVAGYFEVVQGKSAVRINAVYDGNPATDPWSNATNTATVLDVFGPNGLGYIPATPGEVSCSWNGTGADVTNAINSGAFLLQHRDHGGETGWGEPNYGNSDIDDLINEDLTFIFSINCLTGKYNISGECFAEKFHRHTANGHPSGALGIIAASEVSYSFVNDTYVWGSYNHMYPDFLPGYPTAPAYRGQLPAFGNAAGKYFLMGSNWPYNTSSKEVTYHLFHHHGDAFTCLYSEVPQNLTVLHDAVLLAGLEQFTVTADEDALIALSVDGVLLGTAEGTGAPVDIYIPEQYPPSMLDVVVTKQNYYRYHQTVQVIPPDGAYIINSGYEINDANGNNNGKLDYGETVMFSLTLKNVGSEDAENVSALLSTDDEYVTLISNTAGFGDIASNQSFTVADELSFSVAGDVPNGHQIIFEIQASDNDTTWTSNAAVQAHAPVLNYVDYTINDPNGNNNGRLDPGETANIIVSVSNIGSSDAYDVWGLLTSSEPFVVIEADSAMFGDINENGMEEQSFTVTASIITPPGHNAAFNIDFAGMYDINAQGSFDVTVGQFPVLVLDLDGNANSGPAIQTSLTEWGIAAEYTTAFPEDLSSYQAIFVCLGTYNLNHVLTEPEGLSLKNFLLNDGRLYMEGGDTWYYDQQYYPTVVHPMFNINGIADGASDLYLVKGMDATFAEGMNYIFAGDNNYIDHIAPIGDAFTFFYNNSPLYNCGVAYDEGTYKTIGMSFEFGGLGDNTLSTKKDLALKFMQFFGMDPLQEKPGLPEGPASVCGPGSSSDYSTTTLEGADYYVWYVEPSEAGRVIGYDTEVTIEWAEDYTGAASLCVCGMNSVGLGPLSDVLEVTITELPTASFVLTTNNICAGDSVGIDMTLTGVSPWSVSMDIGGGAYSFDIDKPNVPTFYIDPQETVDITVESVIDGTGCENTDSETITLVVDPLPVKPDTPSGPTDIDTYISTTADYSTVSQYADSYVWVIDPANAGTVVSGAQEASITVEWNADYTGNADLIINGVNDCGESDIRTFTVTIANSFGIGENDLGIGVELYPNPNDGNFGIELQSREAGMINISLINGFGKKVYESKDIKLNGSLSLSVNLEDLAEGMYFLFIETEKGTLSRKVIIKK